MTHPAFALTGPTRGGGWLITCDHATNRVPDTIAGGNPARALKTSGE